MLYNTTHKFTKFLTALTQEEIHNCPEYFGMTKEEVKSHPECPLYLKKMLEEIPWSERCSSLQIRPQDFRTKVPMLLGNGWHVDCNVRLKDGQIRTARNIEDWKIMGVSFGDVVETIFIQTPLEMRELSVPQQGDHGEFFFNDLPKKEFTHHNPADCQLAEYTTKDIHSIGHHYRMGKMRLLVLAVESEDYIGGGLCLPSLKKRDRGVGIAFSDYNT